MAGEVWVWAENQENQVPRAVYELLGKGRELASHLETKLAAVLLTKEEDGLVNKLFQAGADKVYLLENEKLKLYQNEDYTRALAELIREKDPEIFLFASTPNGTELAACTAAKVDTGLTAHCVDLYIEKCENKELLVQVVPGFGDNVMVKILTPKNRPQMATVKPGVMTALEKEYSHKGDLEKIAYEPLQKTRSKTLKIIEKPAGSMPLEDAETVVVSGWGFQAAGNIDLAQELAAQLEGAMGGTRPVIDKGWLPEEAMVGQSGKTVSPRLLITLGVSGAMHLTTGISKAKSVLAIDKNKNAPIFKYCDIGIVGDIFQVVPEIILELAKTKEETK